MARRASCQTRPTHIRRIFQHVPNGGPVPFRSARTGEFPGCGSGAQRHQSSPFLTNPLEDLAHDTRLIEHDLEAGSTTAFFFLM